MTVIETLLFSAVSEQSIGNQRQVEIPFGFGLLDIVQVATTNAVGELVDHELQTIKKKRFFKFGKTVQRSSYMMQKYKM